MNSRLPRLSILALAACASTGFAEPKSASEKGIPITNTLPESAVLQYIAPEGRVRRGEIIVVLDCKAAAQKKRETEAAIAEKRAALQEGEESLASAKGEGAARIAEVEQEVKDAERALNKYNEGDGPVAELALQLALHDAEAAWKQQSERFNARDKLLEEGFIQKVEYNNEEVLLKRTKLVLDSAKLKLATFTKFEKEQTADEHARTLEAKKVAVEKLRSKIVALEVASEAAAERIRKNIKALEEERDACNALLQKAVVRALGDGTFAHGDPGRPALKAERGEAVSAGQVLGVIRE